MVRSTTFAANAPACDGSQCVGVRPCSLPGSRIGSADDDELPQIGRDEHADRELCGASCGTAYREQIGAVERDREHDAEDEPVEDETVDERRVAVDVVARVLRRRAAEACAVLERRDRSDERDPADEACAAHARILRTASASGAGSKRRPAACAPSSSAAASPMCTARAASPTPSRASASSNTAGAGFGAPASAEVTTTSEDCVQPEGAQVVVQADVPVRDDGEPEPCGRELDAGGARARQLLERQRRHERGREVVGVELGPRAPRGRRLRSRGEGVRASLHRGRRAIARHRTRLPPRTPAARHRSCARRLGSRVRRAGQAPGRAA